MMVQKLDCVDEGVAKALLAFHALWNTSSPVLGRAASALTM